MKYVKEKEKLYYYDVEMVKNAMEYIAQEFIKGDYGESRETAQELLFRLETILSSLKYEEIDVECKVKETEEEARKYFGRDFITQFEQIRSYCSENNLMLAIHGTNPQILNSIQQEGLMYERPDISETAIIQAGTDIIEKYNNYTGLLNWPHREHKGLVLLGIPRECNGILANGEKETKPLWTEIKTETDYLKKYKINPEFIIGTIDVDKKLILENPLFSLKHDYTGMEYDNVLTDYGRRISIPKEKQEKLFQQEQEQIQDYNNYESLSEKEIKEEKKPKEILIDVKEKLGLPFANLIRAEGKMEGSEMNDYIDSLKYATSSLQNIIPHLREKQEIINEVESFIEDNGNGLIWDDIEWDESIDDLDSYKGSSLDGIEEKNETEENILNSAIESTEIYSKTSDIKKQINIIENSQKEIQQTIEKEEKD